MPSPEDQHRINWLAVMRTLMLQALILLALAVAFAGYVEWSSEATWAEFMSAGNPSAIDSGDHAQTSEVQTVKNQTPCKPKG